MKRTEYEKRKQNQVHLRFNIGKQELKKGIGENRGGENQRKNIRKSLVLKGMSDQHKEGTKIQSKQDYGISEHQV